MRCFCESSNDYQAHLPFLHMAPSGLLPGACFRTPSQSEGLSPESVVDASGLICETTHNGRMLGAHAYLVGVSELQRGMPSTCARLNSVGPGRQCRESARTNFPRLHDTGGRGQRRQTALMLLLPTCYPTCATQNSKGLVRMEGVCALRCRFNEGRALYGGED